MDQLVTLIIILHNRHSNLDRLLAYYEGCNFSIVIADSSKEKHCFAKSHPANYSYLYMPGITYTQKIERTLATIQTPYVAMCADDDFILPSGISSCVDFLEKNNDYAVAQGISICFIKKSITDKNVQFRALYRDIPYDLESDAPTERLNKMFWPYRSNLYAVHRTAYLKTAFAGAGSIVKNLFLNEFLTFVVPNAFGKYKELPILFSVREFAEDSDDKTSIGLHDLVYNQEHHLEFDGFLNQQSNIIAAVVKMDVAQCKSFLKKLFIDFVNELKKDELQIKTSFKKKIGNLLYLIPVLGKQIIENNRRVLYEKSIAYAIKTDDDKNELKKIEQNLIKSTIRSK